MMIDFSEPAWSRRDKAWRRERFVGDALLLAGDFALAVGAFLVWLVVT